LALLVSSIRPKALHNKDPLHIAHFRCYYYSIKQSLEFTFIVVTWISYDWKGAPAPLFQLLGRGLIKLKEGYGKARDYISYSCEVYDIRRDRLNAVLSTLTAKLIATRPNHHECG
jgi:hypothetical protein